MNAQEARKLSDKRESTETREIKALWNKSKGFIFEQIKNAAENGDSKASVDLRAPQLAEISKQLKLLQVQLENLGYKVEFLLTRTPDGAREMILKW